MGEYPPKLFESLRYGGECAVCADECPEGSPGWVYKKQVACPHHLKQDVIDAIDNKQVEMRAEAPSKAVVEPFALIEVTNRLDVQNRVLEAINLELRKIADMGVKVRQ